MAESRAETARRLRAHAVQVRLNIVELVGVGRAGHLGGSCSAADIITALYFYKLRCRAEDPAWEGRDRFLLSKGHAALAQYAALCELGVLKKELLGTVKSLGSILQGHPDGTKCPGIEANTGSLGQGLSIALGMALGLRLEGSGSQVYCLAGDGELAEGQIWEAVMAASSYRVGNLTCIVDNNHVQATDRVEKVLDTGELRPKFEAFGWKVLPVDGHSMEALMDALDQAEAYREGPVLILAETVKGKGIDFAEGQASYHNGTLTQAQYDSARAQILSGKTGEGA